IADVALQGERPAPQRADLVDRALRVHEPLLLRRRREHPPPLDVLLVRLELNVRDRDVRPRARERERVRAPEPAGAAGDERDAPGKIDLDAHRGMSSSRAITSRWICEVPS